MEERKVTKARQSYHDIGICVVVVEDKVSDLLRKIVANELSKKAEAEWLALLLKIRTGHSKNYESFEVLEFLANRDENSQPLESAAEKVLFKEFRNMISSYQMKFKGNERSVNDILKYLKENSKAYATLIKVCIEKFTRDIQVKATDLNNFLGENINGWMPLKEKCFHTEGEDATERLDGCIKYCRYRYRMHDNSKGRWDRVNDMNYIRNDVIHRIFKFKDQDQEGKFQRSYKKFIDEVSFQNLFPLNVEHMEKKEEYMETMTVHDDVKGEIGRWKDEVGRWKSDVGRWKGEVGRWKGEVERLREENRAWMIAYYELEYQRNEESCYLMDEITVLDEWQWQAKVKKRAAKKRAK